MSHIFSITTEDIAVYVQPEYLETESSARDSVFVWLYHIRVENKGKQPVQLLDRYWHITDGYGVVQEVRGPGVVGLQPIIEPNDDFEYTSSVSLSTPSGMMHGFYEMKAGDGQMLQIAIPVFSLDSVEQLRMPN
jgi:ApaG protein